MKTAIIPRAAQNPDWSTIPVLPIDYLNWTDPVDISAWAQICCTDDALWIREGARETAIRAEDTDVLGMPCRDSCLEFFFCPIPGDMRYFNFEFNPNRCLYLGVGSGPADLMRLVVNSDELFQPQVERDAEGWTITYRVPFSFVRRLFPEFSAEAGVSIRANFYKCGDFTPVPHYLSWNPMDPVEMQFHKPENFGELTFA